MRAQRGGALVQIATGADAGFSFEIQGSEGWLRLTGSNPFGFQAGDLKLMSNIPFATPDEPAVSGGFMGAAINAGELYAHLSAIYKRAPTTHPALNTHFITLVSSRL